MTIRIQAIPDACARARIHAGHTTRSAAIALKVSATHLAYVESSQRQPSVKLLKRMADLYGVPMTSLFTEVTDASEAVA